MEIYPAVDLYEGRVVRLEQGDYGKSKAYSDDPVAMAQQWVLQGARWLHLVDLEGARAGCVRNGETVRKISRAVRASLQFGGGVRTEGEIEQLFSWGVRRVILGTKALDPAFIRTVTQKYPGRLALSLDIQGEEIRIEGWLKAGARSIFELFPVLEDLPLSCLIVTDIERDGVMQGINVEKIASIIRKSPHPVIAAGGVSSLEQIVALREELRDTHRFDGVIIGKALYEGKIDLRKTMEALTS